MLHDYQVNLKDTANLNSSPCGGGGGLKIFGKGQELYMEGLRIYGGGLDNSPLQAMIFLRGRSKFRNNVRAYLI